MYIQISILTCGVHTITNKCHIDFFCCSFQVLHELCAAVPVSQSSLQSSRIQRTSTSVFHLSVQRGWKEARVGLLSATCTCILTYTHTSICTCTYVPVSVPIPIPIHIPPSVPVPVIVPVLVPISLHLP